MTVYLGADHRGFPLKEHLRTILPKYGISMNDLGAMSLMPEDDYPQYAVEVANKVASEFGSKGIVMCGSGVGVDMVANKIKGIRCCLGFTKEQVIAACADDNCNMLALPADFLSLEQAEELVDAFIHTSFKGGGKYQRRVDQIHAIENQ